MREAGGYHTGLTLRLPRRVRYYGLAAMRSTSTPSSEMFI